MDCISLYTLSGGTSSSSLVFLVSLSSRRWDRDVATRHSKELYSKSMSLGLPMTRNILGCPSVSNAVNRTLLGLARSTDISDHTFVLSMTVRVPCVRITRRE